MLFGLPPCAPISNFFFFNLANSSQPSGHSKHPFLLDSKDGIRKPLPTSSLRNTLTNNHGTSPTALQLPVFLSVPCYCHLLATFLLFHLFSASNCSIFCQMNDSKSSTSLGRFRRDDVKPMEAQVGKRTYLYSGSSEILPPPTVCTDSGHSRYFLRQQIATFFINYVGSVQRQVYWLPGKYLPCALYTVGIK